MRARPLNSPAGCPPIKIEQARARSISIRRAGLRPAHGAPRHTILLGGYRPPPSRSPVGSPSTCAGSTATLPATTIYGAGQSRTSRDSGRRFGSSSISRPHSPYDEVLTSREILGARWFAGAEVSYAEHIFRGPEDSSVAIVHASELQPLSEWTWGDLRARTASIRASLATRGVVRGDRVAAYMPNVPEAIAAFLATASLGAIWTSAAAAEQTQVVLPDDMTDEEDAQLLATALGDGQDADRWEDRLALADELTVADLAELFGRSPQAINTWVRKGFPCHLPAPWNPDAWTIEGDRSKRLPVSALNRSTLSDSQTARLELIRRRRAADSGSSLLSA